MGTNTKYPKGVKSGRGCATPDPLGVSASRRFKNFLHRRDAKAQSMEASSGEMPSRSHDYSVGNWSTHNFYHADGNGNVTYLVDGSQGLAASYRYDAYGNLFGSSGSLANDNVYRFSSKAYLDPGNTGDGLYYYGYRFYAPNLQRWLNRDPIGKAGGKNLYAFTANGPVGRVDREGYSWMPVPGRKFPDNDSSVQCKGGKPVPRVVWIPAADLLDQLETMAKHDRENNANVRDPNAELKGYLCAQKCSYAHERSHIEDIVSQDPNICANVADGTPIINPDSTELLISELKAHQVTADCLKNCKKTCPSSQVDEQIRRNNKWIDEHTYE